MKRDFNVVVKDYEGRPFVRHVFEYDEKGMPVTEKEGPMKGQQKFKCFEPLTLRLYALEAVGGRWRGEDNMTVEQAKKRLALYDKLTFSPDGVVDVSNDEVTMINECLLKQGRDPIVIGRMAIMLETDPKPADAPA